MYEITILDVLDYLDILLASMTEEVWEGEDADMAREQYDHLVYREMSDTWRQLDTCNESIQNALKQAYEAKNFCNSR